MLRHTWIEYHEPNRIVTKTSAACDVNRISLALLPAQQAKLSYSTSHAMHPGSSVYTPSRFSPKHGIHKARQGWGGRQCFNILHCTLSPNKSSGLNTAEHPFQQKKNSVTSHFSFLPFLYKSVTCNRKQQCVGIVDWKR